MGIFGMSSEAENDPREQIFPNWFDLSIKIHGYETKGAFGTVHVLNSNKGQKTTALKLYQPLSEPKVADDFVCESIDQTNEEFELIKVPKEKKEEKKDDGQPRRMKNFKYTDPISDFGKGAEQLQRRLMVLKSIKCSSIQTFRGYQEDGENFWYMMDYVPKRSVLDEAHWLGRTLKEDETCKVACGMLRALAYLRERRIVHGNIKASNVFRHPKTEEGILGDFRLPGLQTFEQLAQPEASLHWMSPELLMSKGAEATPKSDLWAMAATICELMTRTPPHALLTREELEAEYSKKPWPPRPSLPTIALDHCKDFLSTCFMSPAKRPTAELLMPHPWVCNGLSSGLSHIELSGTLLSDWQTKNLVGVYAPTDTPIPGADLTRPIYKHYKSKVYIFYFEATASWQVAEMKDLGRPRAVLYSQDDVRWPQLIGKKFRGWSKDKQGWIEIDDVSIDVFYTAED